MKTKKLTLKCGVTSFFTALFITSGVFLAFTKKADFTERGVFLLFGTVKYFIVLAVIFAALYLSSLALPLERARRAALLASYIVYAALCMRQTTDVFFALGAAALLVPIGLYVFGENAMTRDLPKKALAAVLAVCGAYFAILIGVETVCRYLTLSTPCFDFGIFSQMFHNMRETLAPVTTCERGVLLSHFAIHVSPIYYLFLPFYAIAPSPVTLQVCQAVILASGLVPLYLLSKKLGHKNVTTAVFAVIYVLYPALGGGTFYDLHENKFLAPLLLFLFYFIEKESYPWATVFALLVCVVKEDAPVYVIFAALWVILSRRDRKSRRLGWILLAVSAVYFGVVTFLLNEFGRGTMNYRYSNFMAPGQSSLVSVVVNVIKDPAYVIHEIFAVGDDGDVSKLTFAVQMLLPLGFLPFITKRHERLVLLLPFILINLMPDYEYQHDIFFQYTYGAFPFLLYSSMLNWRDLGAKTKKIAAAVAMSAALFVSIQTVWNHSGYLGQYLQNKSAYDEVRCVLEEIPEDSSVSASTFFCAALSSRSELYSIDNSDEEHDTDVVAIDLRFEKNESLKLKYEKDENYDTLYFRDGFAAVFGKSGER